MSSMRIGLLRRLPGPPSGDGLRALCAELAAAEEQGFDEVWLASPADAPSLQALAVAAADVATRTRRIGIGLMAPLGAEGHPLHWAETLIQLDILSAGRARFAGRLDEAVGEEARAHAGEQLRVLVAALRGAPVHHRGPRLEVVDVQCHPGPVGRPHPPLAVAGAGAARALAEDCGLAWLAEGEGAVDGSTPGSVICPLPGTATGLDELGERLAVAGVRHCVVRLPAAEGGEGQRRLESALPRLRRAG